MSAGNEAKTAHLQGKHFLRGSNAVNWIAADQLRGEEVSKANLASSSRMTPSLAAASSANSC